MARDAGRMLRAGLAGGMLVLPVSAELLEYSIVPSLTNPFISDYSASDAHLVCIDPEVPARGRLVLFLPGTGSRPADYRLFSQCAAELGYHVIGLDYPNAYSVGGVCNSAGQNEPDCHELSRLEIITGFDFSPHFEVGVFDSISGRLSSLLEYLAVNNPGQNWEQFLVNSEIQWEKIVATGHSQGGGHSLYLANMVGLERCISFSGIDWRVSSGEPASWVNTSFASSVSRIYFFAHYQEWDFEGVTDSFAGTLGIKRYGDHVFAENSPAPRFDETHFFVTDLEPTRGPSEGGLYHNVAIMDADLEFKEDGVTPRLKSAWRYLLTHETRPVRISISASEARIYFSPGQLEFSTDLMNWVEFPYPFTPSPLVIPRDSEAWAERGFYRLDPTP